ncbi:MAG: hypothetical protein GWP91_11515 [Rhodobacterales bacterium]|nr:hypothetical protein [Rhodobacterales bacterium]
MNAVLTLIFWLLMQFGAPNPLCSTAGVDSANSHPSCPLFDITPPPAPPPAQQDQGRTVVGCFINNGF